MRIAFYAPLNPPDSAKPSGDRLIARMLIDALQRAGHAVELVSRLRSLDKQGDAERQTRIAAIGSQLAARLAARLAKRPHDQRPDLWLTYHLYHKAPDWLGPHVSSALNIPYAVAEASFAPKQAGGAWAQGHAAVAAALAKADLALGFNSADMACVRPLLASPDRYLHLKPFIDGAACRLASSNALEHRAKLRQRLQIAPDNALMLSVGMMREGAKLQSYAMLAEALGHIDDLDWHLVIAGDGPMRQRVEAAMSPHTRRISFLGQLAPQELPEIYAAADIFVWPAIKEALGMCFLEAQAAGLPVIGSRTLGVPDVVADGATGILVQPFDVPAFAAAMRSLLTDRAKRQHLGRAATDYFQSQHDITTTSNHLTSALEQLVASNSGSKSQQQRADENE